MFFTLHCLYFLWLMFSDVLICIKLETFLRWLVFLGCLFIFEKVALESQLKALNVGSWLDNWVAGWTLSLGTPIVGINGIVFFFPGKCSLVLTLSFDSNPLPLPFTQSRISLFQCLQNWYSCFLHEWGRGHNKSLDCSGNDWVSWLSNYPLSRSLNNSHF